MTRRSMAKNSKTRLLEVATGITGPGLIHGVLIMSIGERGHAR